MAFESIPCNPCSQWYIDYRCEDCGQLGTARFSGDYMIENGRTGDFEPTKKIYCCECKSENISFDEIKCYDEWDETEPEAIADGAL